MNRAEHFICSSSLWRHFSRRHILPWVLADHPLGDHLLDIGAGYGAATAYFRQRVACVTSLEYDYRSAQKLASLHHDGRGGAVQGDAVQLPFASGAFSAVLAVLVLHHLKSREAQNSMFKEVFRVLRPGGVFLACEITDSWINRLGHFRSTFTPVAPGSAVARLTDAGFSRVACDLRTGAFRFSANRSEPANSSESGPAVR
jgi:SAM-dependent methyltransferase